MCFTFPQSFAQKEILTLVDISRRNLSKIAWHMKCNTIYILIVSHIVLISCITVYFYVNNTGNLWPKVRLLLIHSSARSFCSCFLFVSRIYIYYIVFSCIFWCVACGILFLVLFACDLCLYSFSSWLLYCINIIILSKLTKLIQLT